MVEVLKMYNCLMRVFNASCDVVIACYTNGKANRIRFSKLMLQEV